MCYTDTMKKIMISIGFFIVGVAVVLGIVLAVHPQSLTRSPVDAVVCEAIAGTHCFAYHHLGTVDAPYTTNEYLILTINGEQVTGIKKGDQAGPDMTNGYTGTITGNIKDDAITVNYVYTVEGSKNTEQEHYIITSSGIDKLVYPLIDHYKDGLVPDTSKPFTRRSYQSVACEVLPK